MGRSRGRASRGVCVRFPVGMLEQLPVDGLANRPRSRKNARSIPGSCQRGSYKREFPGRIRFSNPAVSVSSLKLAPAPGGVWVVWVQTAIVNQVMVRLTSMVLPGLNLFENYGYYSPLRHGNILLVSDDGTCHLVFTQGRISRGGVGRPVVVYGTIKSDGH